MDFRTNNTLITMTHNPKLLLRRDYLQGAIDYALNLENSLKDIDQVEYRFVLEPNLQGVIDAITVKVGIIKYADQEDGKDLVKWESVKFFAKDDLNTMYDKIHNLIIELEKSSENSTDWNYYKPI
jgi:hypothetical protein